MAVVGSVAQSKQIHLSKAASIFSRFAATPTAAAGARGVAEHAKAAYLRLASTAFDELVQIQTEVGVVEKAKKNKRGKRSRDDSRRLGEEESDDGGEVVDSNMKRRRIDN